MTAIAENFEQFASTTRNRAASFEVDEGTYLVNRIQNDGLNPDLAADVIYYLTYNSVPADYLEYYIEKIKRGVGFNGFTDFEPTAEDFLEEI